MGRIGRLRGHRGVSRLTRVGLRHRYRHSRRWRVFGDGLGAERTELLATKSPGRYRDLVTPKLLTISPRVRLDPPPPSSDRGTGSQTQRNVAVFGRDVAAVQMRQVIRS